MKKDLQEILDHTFFSIGKFKFDVADIVKLALLFLAVKLILWVIAAYFRRRINKGRIDKGSAFAIRQIFAYFIWIGAILIGLEAIGLNISILLAGSAALLVGIGLGVQQTFNDFFSGIILLMEGSIKVDDVLEFDNMVCRVQRIGIRTSQVMTRDQISVIVPNSKFTGDSVINWTHSQHAARFRVTIGVDYKSDIDLVSKILLDAARNHSLVKAKALNSFIRLEEFADSSINFCLFLERSVCGRNHKKVKSEWPYSGSSVNRAFRSSRSAICILSGRRILKTDKNRELLERFLHSIIKGRKIMKNALLFIAITFPFLPVSPKVLSGLPRVPI
ncbi:MAG: mechanosensitive ion channel [Bacteroidia bacterium]